MIFAKQENKASSTESASFISLWSPSCPRLFVTLTFSTPILDQCSCFLLWTLHASCWPHLEKTHVCADRCPYKVGSLSLIPGNYSVCPWLIDFPFPTSTYDVALVSHSLLMPCDSVSDYLLWVEPSVLRVSSHHLRIMPNPTKAKSTQNPENLYFSVSNLTVDLRQIFVTKIFICTVKLIILSYNLVIV